MSLKQLVADLVSVGTNKRTEFIIDFLNFNKINYHEYHNHGLVHNIEAAFQGTESDQRVIFFAHHDISNQTNEGANDNSSSVVVLLNLALFLKEHPPKLTVHLVFNDTEEILGALLNKNISLFALHKIVANAGSYHFLKKFAYKELIQGIFILELSGIGDAIFISESSGNVIADQQLNHFTEDLMKKNKIPSIIIPILSSDLISAHVHQLPGTVIGAIPYQQAQFFMTEINKNRKKGHHFFFYEQIPAVWKNIHSQRDTIYTIQEKALQLVYQGGKKILQNLEKLAE